MPEEIVPATRERWRDLERLFGPRGAYSGCWCMFWRVRRRDFQKMSEVERRAALRGWIRSGAEPGLIAYRGGKPVAWCAMAPRDAYASISASPALRSLESQGVWSITCYFVAKEHRRTGLMSALLEAAVRHAKRKGARIVEGFPVEAHALSGCQGYTGLVPVYRKAGFRRVAAMGSKRVMRRAVSPGRG
jgi:GNAT superfamily N-acetyltransferase